MENHHFQWENPRTKWAIFNSKLLVYQAGYPKYQGFSMEGLEGMNSQQLLDEGEQRLAVAMEAPA